MKYFVMLFLILGVIAVLQNLVHALEFEPLIAKNTNNEIIFTGIVGQPIIFESTITNNEEGSVDFDVRFSTSIMKDKILDHQTQSIHLESGDATTLTYQFTPTVEGNYYVSGILYGDARSVADHITFSALESGKTYPKKTVSIYSDSIDGCLVACTEPSVLTIDAGTVVEFVNVTPDIRRISTGRYMEDEDGIGWSFDDRFHITLPPDRKASFLFSQSGEYQLSLAEHCLTDVVGTIHVLSDQFREADKTFNILNKIMNDENFGIPISSLYINPKNSVITVGINDKHNPLFTLDIYKTMIYKQVGNVYLNIVYDHGSFETELCDVNNEVAVRAILEKDPVVKQFLQNYPSATFEHFKTGDEPGNPRTYSEFHYGIFVLRTFVSTYDPHGVCYPVYGYSIEYDVSDSLVRNNLPKNILSKSNDIYKAVQAVKTLTSPLQQYKMGIKYPGIQCKDGLELVGKILSAYPKCVKPESSEKLVMRGWATTDKTVELANPIKYVVTKNHINFEVLYSLKGATLENIAHDTDANSVHVTLSDAVGGYLVISIPRDLMDAKMGNNNDDVYFVLIDGLEYMYGEKKTDDSRIITVWFSKDVRDVEIIGTFWI